MQKAALIKCSPVVHTIRRNLIAEAGDWVDCGYLGVQPLTLHHSKLVSRSASSRFFGNLNQSRMHCRSTLIDWEPPTPQPKLPVPHIQLDANPILSRASELQTTKQHNCTPLSFLIKFFLPRRTTSQLQRATGTNAVCAPCKCECSDILYMHIGLSSCYKCIFGDACC